jgi:hypothetical protein
LFGLPLCSVLRLAVRVVAKYEKEPAKEPIRVVAKYKKEPSAAKEPIRVVVEYKKEPVKTNTSVGNAPA